MSVLRIVCTCDRLTVVAVMVSDRRSRYVAEYTHQRSISRPAPSRSLPAGSRRQSDFDRNRLRPSVRSFVVANAAIGDAPRYFRPDQFEHRFVSGRRPSGGLLSFFSDIKWRLQATVRCHCNSLPTFFLFATKGSTVAEGKSC